MRALPTSLLHTEQGRSKTTDGDKRPCTVGARLGADVTGAERGERLS